MSGVVEAVCVSERRGISKTPVRSVEVRADFGIVGDVHAGSAVRQVSILPRESIESDDLVERMAGHRTRLAQQSPDDWNKEEDWMLAKYFESSVGLDRTSQSLNVLVPRGWFLLAIGALAPAVVYGQPTTIGLGIAIGGILTHDVLQRRLDARVRTHRSHHADLDGHGCRRQHRYLRADHHGRGYHAAVDRLPAGSYARVYRTDRALLVHQHPESVV